MNVVEKWERLLEDLTPSGITDGQLQELTKDFITAAQKSISEDWKVTHSVGDPNDAMALFALVARKSNKVLKCLYESPDVADTLSLLLKGVANAPM